MYRPDDSSVLQKEIQFDHAQQCLGFPLPDARKLHGSTKAAAKRRQVALKDALAELKSAKTNCTTSPPNGVASEGFEARVTPDHQETFPEKDFDHYPPGCPPQDEVQARQDLQNLLGLKEASSSDQETSSENDQTLPDTILFGQASFAGSHAAHAPQFETLSDSIQSQIPMDVVKLFHLHKRQLYSHQVQAIEAAMASRHVSVCTGTGSGKSLCFLLPVLVAACTHDATSLLLFPTKALAQDQLSKLQSLLKGTSLENTIRPATLDGDTNHAARSEMDRHMSF